MNEVREVNKNLRSKRKSWTKVKDSQTPTGQGQTQKRELS